MSPLTHQLIRYAERKAPPSLAERLEEEWLADLTERHGHLSRALFGLGCCWATTVIAFEHRALNISTASTASGRGTMSAYFTEHSPFSRRTVAFAGIVALHAVVIYGFATGLGQHVFRELPTAMLGDFLQEPKVHDAPPPVHTDVKFTLTKVDIPPPVTTDIDLPPEPSFVNDPNANSITPPAPVTETFPTIHPVQRVGGGPGKGFPNSEDFYPPAAIRADQTGTSTIHVCVAPSGQLSSPPTLGASSGSALLDQGALRLAKAGSGHYRPGTENGTAVNSCFGLRITFDLKH